MPARSGCGCDLDVALLDERLDQHGEALRVHLHALEEHAVRQLVSRSVAQLLNGLEAFGVERIVGDVPCRHEEHPPRLVHHERGCPLDGGQTDAWGQVVLADGVEERQLAGLLADTSPDRGADRIALGLGGGVLGFGLFAALDQQPPGLVGVVDHRGHGIPVLQVARAGPVVGPPLGRREHAWRQIPDDRPSSKRP